MQLRWSNDRQTNTNAAALRDFRYVIYPWRDGWTATREGNHPWWPTPSFNHRQLDYPSIEAAIEACEADADTVDRLYRWAEHILTVDPPASEPSD